MVEFYKNPDFSYDFQTSIPQNLKDILLYSREKKVSLIH